MLKNNIAIYIGNRLQLKDSGSFSAGVIKIATWSVAIGIAVMIVAVGIMSGFTNQVTNKVFSFGGHITVNKFGNQQAYENAFVDLNDKSLVKLYKLPTIKSINTFTTKPALMKRGTEVQGVFLKGLGADYQTANFRQNLVAGRFPHFDTAANHQEEVMLSTTVANLTSSKVGDDVVFYFLQQPPRFRRCKIVGLYSTGFEEFDETTVIANQAMLQTLNLWPSTNVSGLEIMLKDVSQLDTAAKQVYTLLPYDLGSQTIKDSSPQIFDWLQMIARNVQVLLILIAIVACINIISTMLIMILERTKMIGMLKTLGAKNSQLRNLFVVSGFRFITKGMIYGNILGLGLCAIQYYTHLVPLDQANYYMAFVPIAWPWSLILLINTVTLIVTSASLLLPAMMVASVKPITALKLD